LISATYLDVWDELLNNGFSIVKDGDMLVANESCFRSHMLYHYFNNSVVRPHSFDVPADRERARDVLKYTWQGTTSFLLEEAESTKYNEPEVREYSRFFVLNDISLLTWVSSVLKLVPPKRRRISGTFGINLLRTHTNVVSGPHQDNEEFVIVYVVAREGAGAVTTLYNLATAPNNPNTEDAVCRIQLQPGELLIFQDASFLHDVSPLEPGGHRDAIVCTVDYPREEPR
jgi:hypothetical protein